MSRQRKNIDSVTRAQLIKAFCWMFSFLALLGFVLKQLVGVAIAAAVSVVLSYVIVFLADRFGLAAGTLYGGRRPNWKDAEFYEADIHKIRHWKAGKEYDKALREVNRVLKESPDLADALYLKAQILYEGFGNASAAKHSLEKILAMDGIRGETIYRWAASLKEELER